MRSLALFALPLLAAAATAQTTVQADAERTAVEGLRARAATGTVRLRLVSERAIEGVPVFETDLVFREEEGVLRAEIVSSENGNPVRRTVADGATVIAYDLVKNTATWGNYGKTNEESPVHPKYRPYFFATLRAAARAQESEALRILDLAMRPETDGAALDWMAKGRYDEDTSSSTTVSYVAPADRSLRYLTNVDTGEPLAVAVHYSALRPVGAVRVPIGWTATFEEGTGGATFAPFGADRRFRYLALPRTFRI